MTPTLKVEVALAKGPNDTVVDGDYTDLSDRVLGFTMDRGRDDRTQSFDPGTCSITLDNEDRMLDPIREGALNEAAADLGLPLCPIRVSVVHDGGTDRIFTGYIGPEAWVPVTSAWGKWAVRLDAMDRLALMANIALPSSPWAMQVQTLAPDWWIRSPYPGSVTAGLADSLIDASGNNYSSTVATSVGGNMIYAIDSLVPDDDDAAMTHEQGVSVYTDEADLIGAEANVTMGCVWRGTPHAVDQEIIRQRNMTGSIVRWRLHCTTAGDLVAIIYDAAGVATDFVAAPANPASGSGGRWDDDEPHLVFVRVEGSTRLRVYADGETASVTASIPATVQGRVIFGGGDQLASFDEVMFWLRSVTLDEMDSMANIFLGVSGPFPGDTMEERLERWWDVTSHPRGVSDLVVHTNSTEAYDTVRPVESIPGSLADAFDLTATQSFFGSVWVDRSGAVRARSIDALTDSAWITDYDTPSARLTDVADPDLTYTVVRRTQPQFTGLRLDRVINVERVTISGQVFEVRDDESVARYGERARSRESVVYADPGEAPPVPPPERLAFYSSPTVDVEPVTVYPLIDPGAATWVFEDLELEKPVILEWVDGGTLFTSDPTTPLHTLAVQGESWSWDVRANSLEVSVTLGSPVENPPFTATAYDDGTVAVLSTEDLDALTSESDADLSDSL